MKKKLEAELISIAHRILKIKDKSTLPLLQEEAKNLYEKLTILTFAESHFTDPQPTIGQIRAVFEEEASISTEQPIVSEQPKTIVSLEVKPEPLPQKAATIIDVDTTIIEPPKEEKIESRPEIVIEKINEKVTGDLFVPATEVAEENSSVSAPVYEKNDKEDIGDESSTMPIINTTDEKPKSLNDQLKKGIHIGLNDRLAFIKYLFDGSSTDYNRVLSQLNTLNSKSGAQEFIRNMVKPDYNNWEGKEEYEERFIAIVTNKYEF